ncbi:sensor histidine kinase [Endozoicomonas sp. OPT23]|uniref:ATP-binding protein n=1 Tax=Endozoicomonas sp. OPT23 TaxID=2072845 RepID=UPI00129C0899|nr:ATP-binding protein [Endozoicomonas sp. OPT23]MRI35188.1 sensor histidine kinase [Endozoicomonas sp. OPT23]
MNTKTRLPAFLCLLATAVVSLAGWVGMQVSYTELRKNALNELFRYRTSIQYLLEQYQPLPEIMAGNPRLVEGLQNAGQQQDINIYLEQMAEASEASVIYLMDAQGNTIAASNWQSPVNFLGKNFSFRPYFRQAIMEGSGHYFALGTTSKTRGYYFSRRIDINGLPAGVLVVKLDMDGIEEAWESPWERHEAAFVVTDNNGVVFISTRPKWRFHTLEALSDQQEQQLALERRYDNLSLKPLTFLAEELPYSLQGSNSQIRQVGLPKYLPRQFLVQRVAMPEADWQLYLFIRTTSVYSATLMAAMITATVIILALFGWLYLRERRRRYQAMKKARDTLDRTVQKRTQELNSANHQLVQAAKLAVLGQMSAGINHELNQPLTAIRSYTENAMAFIERERTDIAHQNMSEVLELTDHMSSIVRQLKVFARKSEASGEPVDLQTALTAALKIVGPSLNNSNVILHHERANVDPIIVSADLVRLEQVIVNLLSNAIDAAKGREPGIIWIRLRQKDSHAELQVIDNGSGLPKGNAEQVFEPFFTTRSIDQGLGLGLSISRHIIESLNGSIQANNTLEGGACFTVCLPLLESTRSAVTQRDEKKSQECYEE